MSFLVDTNVLSESAKPKPDAGVMAWLRENERELYVSQIAAIAKRHGLTVVTRNTRDYARTGVKVLNPFG